MPVIYEKMPAFDPDVTPTWGMGSVPEQGERVWKWFEDYDYDPDDFTSIGEEVEETPTVQKGKIGNAECRIFDLKAGVDFAKTWLMQNRFGG